MADGPSQAIGGARWWPGPGVERGRLCALVDAALRALASGAAEQKRGRRKESFLLALDGAAPDHLLKVNRYESLPIWRRLRRSKAREELARAEALAAQGIPTPVPVLAGEVRHNGLLERCYGLVPWLSDATDLATLWSQPGAPSERRAWTRALGVLVRRMHDAGAHQRDLAPNNFLWRPVGEPHLLAVDFERTRLRTRVDRRARAESLAKLDRHFAGAGSAARMRFLRAYAGGDAAEERRWWREIERCLPQLARRDRRHWRRTATHAGRRFDVLRIEARDGEWRGWMRRGAPIEAIRAWLAGNAPPRGVTETCGAMWVRSYGALSDRAAERAWGEAQMLHQRRLLPEPLALLRTPRAAALFLARYTDDFQLLTGANAAGLHSAVTVAVDRLLALGLAPRPSNRGTFAGSLLRNRVVLLDPIAWAPAPAPATGRRALARRLASGLV